MGKKNIAVIEKKARLWDIQEKIKELQEEGRKLLEELRNEK